MIKEIYYRNTDKSDDSLDESDERSGSGLNEPKHSPMRSKEKFRIKDFKTVKKPKNRKRNLSNKIDFEFWEE